jgi:uncharacterized Zn-binding protein involved in type VI secretion
MTPAEWTPSQALENAVANAPRAADTGSAMFGAQGVTGRYAQGWRDSMTGFRQAFGMEALPAGSPPRTSGQQAAACIRAVQSIIGNIMGAISLPQDLLNVGFANLTAPIAALFPAIPAATLGSLYIGLPHAHSHPPSLIPPAPPVPLPSIGSVLLGTSVKVLINYMPAARCGDIGLAPTCVGIVPFFQIKTGSSKVFIGGNRAARMLDICQACTKADDRKIEAGKALAAVGAAARAASTALQVAGYVAGGAAIVADIAEAATDDDAAMSAAKGLSAGMGAAQMAADLAAAALTKTMGTDPAIPPGGPNPMGAITLGHPNVMIGGFPMVNIPNPVNYILDKLKRYVPRRAAPDGEAHVTGCTACPKGA